MKGMEIARVFTKKGKNVFETVNFIKRDSIIKNPDGSIVFQEKDVETPDFWSQTATDVLAQKYFKRAKIPLCDEDGYPIKDAPKTGKEKSLKQVVNRMVGAWRHWGEKEDMFASKDDADAFEDEMKYILINQMGSPNSPQWFNTGLSYLYGFTGDTDGHYYWDAEKKKVIQSTDAYERVQAQACAAGNTVLFTEIGMKTIKEIVDNNMVGLNVWDGTKFTKILATKNNGIKQLHKVNFKNGNSIEFTNDHKILTKNNRKNEWVEIKDSYLKQAIQTSIKSPITSVWDEEAFLAGWICGDGYYGKYPNNARKNKNLLTQFGAITINDDEYAAVTKAFDKIFGHYTVVTNKHIHDKYRTIKYCSKNVDWFITKYNLYKKSLTFDVADEIFFGTRSQQINFLKGLFQTDGYVNVKKTSGHVGLGCISESLIKKTQIMLFNLGISSLLTKYIDPRSNRHPMYYVKIGMLSERKKFENLIGFISEDKKEKLRILNNYYGKNRYNLSPITITSIIPTKEDEVYDIQTESGQFTANGIVVHNCFIQHVEDKLLGENGIFDLAQREGRLFKYGSGTGTNFSTLRGKGEPLSAGGVSSGLMSYLKIYDTIAGSIKSGGTTRRAAKMVALDIDHPEIEAFINWKMEEEIKVADMVAGSKTLNTELNNIMKVANKTKEYDPMKNIELSSAIKNATKLNVPINSIFRALQLAMQGKESISIAEMDTHYESAAYMTVSGQNSNNSIVVPNPFFNKLKTDENWELKWRTNGGKVCKVIKARELWDKICYAAWNCADPGLIFFDTVNEWHTCPVNGPIRSSNPCVTGDTKILMGDGSWKRIDSLINKPSEIQTNLKELKTVKIKGSFLTGIKDVWMLTTMSGKQLKLTPDHKVFTTNRGFIEARHLKTTDVLKILDIEYDYFKELNHLGIEKVYDITEPITHSFIANGITVHNCSEYFFLDNSSCNLASLNLKKFIDEEKGTFMVDEFVHACRLWTIVLEISIQMAHFPSKEIAEITYKTRSLGLGFANLGSILMLLGKAYDSDEGRAWAAGITSLMTSTAYTTSAEMASFLGAFEEYDKNKTAMLNVINNHRLAAQSSSNDKYSGLSIFPQYFDYTKCDEDIVTASRKMWDKAYKEGEKYGFRNAQTTLIAPTGTIGIQMDCDTTGIEPDFALVKFKKLAGGGYFKIVNQGVPAALKNLGYTKSQIDTIIKYITGYGTLEGSPTISFSDLRSKGFGDEQINILVASLKTAFDVSFVFNKFAFGEEFLEKLKISKDKYNLPDFNLLNELGYSEKDIELANKFVCGTMTIEGAPYIKDEHLNIFDCANKCGRYGKRFIAWKAHIKMMAAAQPFLSGAISKTINMPSDATIKDIGDAYLFSWNSMLKSNALYRDGSKLSQPLNAVSGDIAKELLMVLETDDKLGPQEVQEKIGVYLERRRLPNNRRGRTQEIKIDGHKVYIHTGEYEDGTLGEVFISMYKDGAAYRSLLSCFSVAISKALQYGVPLDEFVDSFTFTRFDPAGIVIGHDNIKAATSIIDFVFRYLGYEYLGRTDFLHIKPIESESAKDDELEKIIEPKIISIAKKLDDKIVDAKSKGYTGESCRECGSMKVRRNGTCTLCEECGSTSGCS
jgi:ribonucleotide reductase alpha subunit